MKIALITAIAGVVFMMLGLVCHVLLLSFASGVFGVGVFAAFVGAVVFIVLAFLDIYRNGPI